MRGAPQVSVSALVEVEATPHGWVEAGAARAALRAVTAAGDSGGAAAVVMVRGVLTAPPAASAEAARLIGAALADADRIGVLANGPGAAGFAAAVQAAAAQERMFRSPV